MNKQNTDPCLKRFDLHSSLANALSPVSAMHWIAIMSQAVLTILTSSTHHTHKRGRIDIVITPGSTDPVIMPDGHTVVKHHLEYDQQNMGNKNVSLDGHAKNNTHLAEQS